MSDRRKRTLRWLTVLLYTGLILFVGFLHTETSIRETKDCPACNFLKSAVSVSPAPVYISAALFPIDKTELDKAVAVRPSAVTESVSRAPPLG